ncbi:MAG: enoyl-CoA hydratase-related protein [Proteobacteria bacterium]|nr:enoyl-CoA hydratase-related protein [Pseudomonadota bacterium]
MEQYVSYEVKDAGYALLTLCREPVNSMNLDLWRQLAAALDALEANPKVRGVIFQSGLKKDVFTAGNDLLELYAPQSSEERYRDFWVTQNKFFARLYRSPLVTVAAIRGACPAGGCALALCCDYRIMSDFGMIGLNEVALGIPVPEYWAKLFKRTVGQRQAERLLPYGLMVSAEEALKIGLVDSLLSVQELSQAAEEAMKKMLVPGDAGRQATKKHLRGDFSLRWEEFCVGEAALGWKLISHPRSVQAIEAVLQRLSKGKKD